MVAILTVSPTVSILADAATSPATTPSVQLPTTVPINVTPVPGVSDYIVTGALLGLFCVASALAFVWIVRPRDRIDDALPASSSTEPETVLPYARDDGSLAATDAYRLAIILFGSLVLMTLLPSVLVGAIGSTDARSLQLIGATTRAIVLAAALLGVALTVRNGFAKIGLQIGKLPQAWKGIVGLVLAAPWIYLTLFASQIIYRVTGLMPEQQTHETLTLIRTNTDTLAVAIATFGAVVLAPVMEEVLFRGLLQTSIARVAARPWVAIGATSLLFALIHPPFSIPAIFVLSLTLGYLYHRTQNLWAAIAFHIAFNAANTGLTLLMR